MGEKFLVASADFQLDVKGGEAGVGNQLFVISRDQFVNCIPRGTAYIKTHRRTAPAASLRGTVPTWRQKMAHILQTAFTRYDRTVTVEWPQSFIDTFNGLPENFQYLVAYGAKQSESDAFAAAKNADEFEGKLLARHKAIIDGTVRAVSQGSGRGAKKTPLEREIRSLAELDMAGPIEGWEKKNGQRMAKDRREAYIDLYVNRELAVLTERAKVELERRANMVAASPISLDDLTLPASEAPAETPAKRNRK